MASLDAESLAALIAAMKAAKLDFGAGKDGRGLALVKPDPRKGGKGAGFAYLPNRATDRNMKIAAKTPNAKVNGQRGKTNAPIATITTLGDPDKGASSATPYYEASATTRRASEGALGKENIPAPYRKQVKDYFDAIR